MPEQHVKKHVLTPEMEKHKWKKGVSGNPNGRPKGSGLTDVLLKEMEKVYPDDKQKRTWKENIVLATMKLAMRGNTAALKEVWERMDGKITLPIENVGDITFIISDKHLPKNGK